MTLRSRAIRCSVTLFVLCSVMFSQFALAFYQCPADRVARVTVSTAAEEAGEQGQPGCDGMDMEQPALCHAHVQVGNQSLDRPDAPRVDLFMPSGFIVVSDPFTSVLAEVPPVADDASFLNRRTEPEISIRNCCLRV